MTKRWDLALMTALRSAAAGVLALLMLFQYSSSASAQGKLQRVGPKLAAPKRENLTRPTRPAEVEPGQPLLGSEVFVERYPDGTVKIEREVTLDAEGNYVNHGPWRMWNQSGKLVAEGSFQNGQRNSVWTRWYDRNDAQLFSQQPFRRFQSPFLSQAVFENGVLDGEWAIFDAQQRRCCQISLSQGKRQGMALFWLPDGTVLQQSMYEFGVPTGDVLQLDTNTGKLVRAKHFLQGREFITKKSNHNRSRQLKIEATYLAPTSIQTAADDYWNLQFAKYEPQGEELRHGKWQEWHPNGQLKVSGQYDRDKRVGEFTYWHANGQKAAEGKFLADKPAGNWVWWHQNGQKSVTGDFENGLMVDQWRWWAENGKLKQQSQEDGTQTYETLADEGLQLDKNAQLPIRKRR